MNGNARHRQIHWALLLALGWAAAAAAAADDPAAGERPASPPRRSIAVNETGFVVDGEPFLIKGMAYSPFYPGESNRDKISKADVADDMRRMRELGINTLLVYWTRDARIYREARRNGLMILHGIWIDQEPSDFHEPRFKEGVKRQIRHAIDYIHNLDGEDYSDTILGFWIGGEFSPASVDGTDTRHPEIVQFEGTHYRTRKGAAPTECFLAEMCDYARGYAGETYGNDFLFSHVNWPPTEPWLKLDFLDYALFDVYSFWPPEVVTFRKGSFAPTSYQGYIEHLKKAYPRIPVIVSEFGMSTAPDNVTTSGNNERDQATELIARWHDIVTASPPLGGGIVFEWNDEWWKQSGAAVLIARDADKNHHERDDAEEWFGIVGIDGPSKLDYTVRPKQSYHAVRRMYAPSFTENRRALEPIGVEGEIDSNARSLPLRADGLPLDASRQLHLVFQAKGDPEAMKARLRLDAARRWDRDDDPSGESLPLERYPTGTGGSDDGWRTILIPLEHFGPLDFSVLLTLGLVHEEENPPDLSIRDIRFSPND